MSKNNWVVHVVGSDEVFIQADELSALREANALNKSFVELPRGENYPFVMALAKNTDVENV